MKLQELKLIDEDRMVTEMANSHEITTSKEAIAFANKIINWPCGMKISMVYAGQQSIDSSYERELINGFIEDLQQFDPNKIKVDYAKRTSFANAEAEVVIRDLESFTKLVNNHTMRQMSDDFYFDSDDQDDNYWEFVWYIELE